MTYSPVLGPNHAALITGGSSGIGLALAKQLARLGNHVWLTARGLEQLQAALSELEANRVSPEQIFGFTPADLTDPDLVANVLDQVTHAIGTPDLLINSAGIVEPGRFHDLDLDDFHSQMAVNYFGTVYMTKAVIPGMLARGSGSIVNIASMGAAIGLFGYTAYGASKFAVRGFTEALRSEMKPHGIHVMLVYPPDTDTPQLAYDNQTKPPETKVLSGTAKVMSAETVADDIIKGIQHHRFKVVPGLDSKLLFSVIGLSSAAVFLIIDVLVSRTQRKQTPPNTNGEKS